MQKIIPLKPQSRGEEVVNLHKALNILIEKNILEIDEREWSSLASHFQKEERKSYYGEVTARLVQIFQKKQGLESTGVVDEVTANLLNEILKEFESKKSSFKVEGTVRYPDNSFATGFLVKAFDKDLRSEQFLGETTTNLSGEYTITYSRQQFKRVEKKSADLIIRIADQEAPEQILAESAILYNAPESATINITVEFSLSEYERLLNAISPLYKGEDVLPIDLTEDDIDFLAQETGFKKDLVQVFADAAGITRYAAINPDISLNDYRAFFYGMGRKGQQLVIKEILVQDFYLLRMMVNEAQEENIIPKLRSNIIDLIFKDLDRVFNEHKLKKPHTYIDMQQKDMRVVGRLAGLSSEQITILIDKAVDFSGIDDDLLLSLVETGALGEIDVKKLSFLVSLYHLSNGNIFLIKHILNQTEYRGQTKVDIIRSMAAWPEEKWQKLSNKGDITPSNEVVSPQDIEGLKKRIRNLYPDEAFCAYFAPSGRDWIYEELTANPEKLINRYVGLKLDEIINDGNPEEKIERLSQRINLLESFQKKNSEINLLAVDYVPGSDDLGMLDLSDLMDHKKIIFDHMKTRQRMYSITGDVDDTIRLMESGYTSIKDITRDNLDIFREKTGFPFKKADNIYKKAESKILAENNG